MIKKPKTITAYRCNMKTFGQTTGEFFLFRQTDLLPDGKTESETEWNEDGDEYSHTQYVYDDEGRVLEKESNFETEGNHEKFIYTYDENGHVLREELYYEGDLFDTMDYRRNAKGEVLEQIHSDAEGNIIERSLAEPDENGRTVRQIFWGEEEEPDRIVDLSYDAEGRVSQEHARLKDGSEEITAFEYNAEGKKTRSEVHDAAGNLIGLVIVDYDDKGQAIKYLSETYGFSPGRMINQVTYDDNGRILENEFYDIVAGCMISRESFDYDDDGNIRTHDVYEINPNSSGKKTHYRLQMEYEFYVVEEEVGS